MTALQLWVTDTLVGVKCYELQANRSSNLIGSTEVRDNKYRLYEELKEQILTMDLQPDSQLDDLEICTQYGLSRTPVRDTLRRLAGE